MQFNRHYLIIADAKTLPSWERNLVPRYGESSVKTLELPASFFEKENFHDWYLLKQYFNQIAHKLAEYKAAVDLRHLVVFIPARVSLPFSDNPLRHYWNPRTYRDAKKSRGDGYHREMVFAWLILAFPEVRFVFYADTENSAEKKPERLHLMQPTESVIEYIQSTDYLVLFDPSGLRDSLRDMISNPNPRHPGVWRRSKTAIVLEDEMTFSYFCGYTAYRYGCKTWVAQNYRQAENLLSEDQEIQKIDPGEVDVSMEDLRLGFPDKEGDIKLSHLVDFHEQGLHSREEMLPQLLRVENRFIITYGGVRGDEEKAEKRLSCQVETYNRRSVETTSWMRIVYKPLSDIYSLGRRTNLYKLWRDTRKTNAKELESKPNSREKSVHSAEGILLDIAEILMIRVKRILWEKKTIQDLIHAALLALEAKELLGGKTPTISLEALGLQHRSEVLAECGCYGTDYELDVPSRVAEIRKEVELICQWYRPGKCRTLAELSARSMIVGDLSKIYSDAKQIEELDQCLIETRRLSGLSFMYHNSWAWPFYPFRWYFEFLQRSLKHFSFAIACWFIILLTIWSWYFADCGKSLNELSYSLLNQFWSFDVPDWVSGPQKTAFPTSLLTTLPFLIGITHIGFLISNLHARIQRK